MELKKSMSQKLRMDGRDYSRPGWYFLTLGTDYHQHLFGRVEGSAMQPNELGRLVERCWEEIPQHYGHIELGAWQVMPNHFHGLIRIVRPGGKGLGEVVNVFKGAVTREWRRQEVSRNCGKEHRGKEHGEKEQGHGEQERGNCGKERGPGEKERGNCGKVQVWAPNYYDVICFDAEELEVRENYVRANPRRWALKSVPQGRSEGGFYKGNLELLKTDAQRKALRVSRRASDEEVEGLKRELAAFDGTVFSTFFSGGERACLKTVLSGSARVVWVLPMALPERIPPAWTNAFLEGRALWFSSHEVAEATRTSCEQANKQVQQLCELRAK